MTLYFHVIIYGRISTFIRRLGYRNVTILGLHVEQGLVGGQTTFRTQVGITFSVVRDTSQPGVHFIVPDQGVGNLCCLGQVPK